MNRYAQHVNHRVTPQNEAASPKQVKNSAGGYAFQLDAWGRLDRFLILGAEGGTYYATERELTKQNATCIEACLLEDGLRTVARIVEVSDQGRAPKNDAAIFALAMAAGAQNPMTRKAALAALPKVCRIGTHLFQFITTVKNFRGWGRALREAVCHWYIDRKPDNLAYQVVKYQQRGGISHRDVLRLAGGALSQLDVSPEQKAVFRWVVAGPQWEARTVQRKDGRSMTYDAIDPKTVPAILDAYERIKKAETWQEVVKLIGDHRLTHEMVPNQFKQQKEVWEALLQHMPITAMLRQLGKLTAVGVLGPMSDAAQLVAQRFNDVDVLRRGRVHPLAFLVALNTYRSGHGVRGSLTWEASPQIIDALDAGFYLAFKTIEPTNKKRLIALDVSGSMTCGAIAGLPGLTPRVASAAMAMTTVRTEPNYHVLAFTSAGWDNGVMSLDLSKRMRLDTVMSKVSDLRFGGTDCALPMIWALENKVEMDAVEIFTDNETWHGSIHPHQALEQYRQKMGRDCKLIVAGMTATNFSIANPDDQGMLDVVGFDPGAPSVMADFVRGGF